MPLQKEVIHLAIGTLPHYITTHFFNQQTSHFDYIHGGAGESPGHGEQDRQDASSSRAVLDPTVDFQEGLGALTNEPTFFPRQVVVDFRDNIGTQWDAYSLVYHADEDDGGGSDQAHDSAPGWLRSQDAAQEGLRAWHSPAEVEFAQGKAPRGLAQKEVYDGDDEDGYTSEDSADDTESETRRSRLAEATSPHRDGDASSTANDMPQTQSGRSAPRSLPATPAMYAHNPHHPRSLRALPHLFRSGTLAPMMGTPDEGQAPLATFEMGMSLAREMERDTSMLDEHIRWFAEDSDLLQAFNLYASTSDGFAGMAHETLELLADEFPKTPVIAWGAAHGSVNEDGVGQDAHWARLRKMNNLLSLWSLSSASLYVPMQVPDALQRKDRSEHTTRFSKRIDWSHMYNASGLLASHIDTATLPTRVFDSSRRRPAAALTSSLNWRRDTPIASLGGCMPMPLLAPVKEAARLLDPIEALLASRGYGPRKNERAGEAPQESADERARRAASIIEKHHLSLSQLSPDANNAASKRVRPRSIKPFAREAVARDGDPLAAAPTSDALEAWNDLDEPAGRSDFYSVPFNVRSTAYPQLFRGLTSNGRLGMEEEAGGRRTRRSRVETMPMMASLSTTPTTAQLLDDARKWLDTRVIRGHAPMHLYGLGGARGRSGAGQAANDDTEGPLGGRDGMHEVRERLEELLGAYDDDAADVAGVDDNVGTDEEVAAADDSDWDLSD